MDFVWEITISLGTQAESVTQEVRGQSVTDQGSGLPQSIEIDWRPDKKFRQGFTGAPATAGETKNKQKIASLVYSPRRG